MNKKLMIGALALSATAVFGLAGCDNAETPEDPKVPTYTVTFDHDNNPNTAPVDVIKYNHGDVGLTTVPAAPEVDGFAGVWDSYTLNNEDITVTAHYGEGTQVNPYMIATPLQFQRFVDEYTAYVETVYTTTPEIKVEEADSLIKIVKYKTVSLVYTRATTSDEWEFDHYDTTNKVYFKLIADIDMSYVPFLSSTDLTGRYFAGCLDGNHYNIRNFDGSMFKNTNGAMIENIVGATFKNLKIHMGANIGSLVAYAIDGDNVFENIEIYNEQETPTFVSVDDTNESPFIFHAFGENTTLTFKNCINKADMVMAADYCGLFLGGYAKNIKTLTFNGCVNMATIKSSGSLGMLIGNGSYSPADLIVDAECKNLGSIESKKQSNILVSHAKGSGLIAGLVDDYNTEDRFQNYESETVGSISELNSEYKAVVSNANITVSNKIEWRDVETGSYQLILSAYAANARGENYMTLLTNIVIKANVEQGQSYTFENALYGMMDLNTYKNATLANDKVDVDMLDSSDWTKLEGYNGKYFVDEANGIYVIDFAQVELDYGVGENKFDINKTASQLNKVVVVYNEETKDIEFIADFE